jgi:predicted ATPase
LARALGFAAGIRRLRREQQEALEREKERAILSGEQGFGLWRGWDILLQGVALAEQDRVAEGIVKMRQGLAAFRAIGLELSRPEQLGRLAEAYGKAGQPEEGLQVVEEALVAVHRTKGHRFEAEWYRLKGQLTLQKFQVSGFTFQVPNTQHPAPNPQVEAEACFLKATDIARGQSAKSLELRAAISLARLWQQQGKREEARQMLAEIYGWFTEGFDAADLQEAKTLLEHFS